MLLTDRGRKQIEDTLGLIADIEAELEVVLGTTTAPWRSCEIAVGVAPVMLSERRDPHSARAHSPHWCGSGPPF